MGLHCFYNIFAYAKFLQYSFTYFNMGAAYFMINRFADIMQKGCGF